MKTCILLLFMFVSAPLFSGVLIAQNSRLGIRLKNLGKPEILTNKKDTRLKSNKAFSKIQFQNNEPPDSVSAESKGSFTFSGYIDSYYSYFTDPVGKANFQQFTSVSARRRSIGLNIAMLSADYAAEKYRATVTLQYGDIPLSSWSPTYNMIQEANAGVRLVKNLWLDAGFFKTHMGPETMLPRNNILSSVAVGTFFKPFYESAIRLNYNPSPEISLYLFALNGYNRFEDNNNKKSLGFLGTYALSENIDVNYSNYLGDDSPVGTTTKNYRFYNNLFVNVEQGNLKLQVGIDACLNQNANLITPTKTAGMYSGLISGRYMLISKFSVFGRLERFHDRHGFLSGTFFDKTVTQTGLILWGGTLGMEFLPTPNSYIRLEGRGLQTEANQEIFQWKGLGVTRRWEVMVHLGISLFSK